MRKLILISILLLSASTNLFAQSYCRCTTPINNESEWNTASNWSCGFVPTSNDHVIIRSTVSINFHVQALSIELGVNSPGVVGHMTIESGGSVEAHKFNLGGDETSLSIAEGGTLTLTAHSSDVSLPGILQMPNLNSSLTVNGSINTELMNISGGSNTVLINETGEVNVNSTITTNGSDMDLQIMGDLTVGSWNSQGATTSSVDVLDGGHVQVLGNLTHLGFGIEVEEGGIFEVDGDFEMSDDEASLDIDGSLTIGGSMTINDGSDIFMGPGSLIEVEQDLIVSDEGSRIDHASGDLIVHGDIYCEAEDCSVVLPVVLKSFSVKSISQTVALRFEVASQENNDFFTIEKSNDGTLYSSLTKISGAGNTKENITYDYTDKNPSAGLNYYRLSQTDYDGTTTLLATEIVEYLSKKQISVYPQLVKDRQLTIGNFTSSKVSMHLIDLLGHVVYSQQVEAGKTGLNLSDLSRGTYVCRFVSADGLIESYIISVQ